MKHTSQVVTDIEVTLTLTGREFEELWRLARAGNMPFATYTSTVDTLRYKEVLNQLSRVRSDLQSKHYGYPGVK